MNPRYKLLFCNSDHARKFPRYRVRHNSIESAQQAAWKVREQLDNSGESAARHQPLLYGPDCGIDGLPLEWERVHHAD